MEIRKILISKNQHLFITGTDTGVGKTFVSTLLAKRLDRRYWKPIQSGMDLPTDSQLVAQILSPQRVLPELYLLRAPLSPHESARLEQKEISITQILSTLTQISDPLVIEGAGGLLVPLNEHDLMIDLILAMNCPVILVARSTLGTINHTLLSLEALRSRNMEPLGVIMVGPTNTANRKSLEQFGRVCILAEIPWVHDPLLYLKILFTDHAV